MVGSKPIGKRSMRDMTSAELVVLALVSLVVAILMATGAFRETDGWRWVLFWSLMAGSYFLHSGMHVLELLDRWRKRPR